MGSFRVPIEIGPLSGGRRGHMEALVDTGATYTWVPGPTLRSLGIEAHERRPFVLADGREVFYEVGWASIHLGRRHEPTLVVFGDPESQPLLGVFTLEGFGLAADPVNRRLFSVPGLLKRAAAA